MDLQGRITAYVWGKIIPKEASDCADFILEIPGIMETRQALADLVAAAEPVLRAFNAEKEPSDEDVKALDDATDNGRNVLK